MGMVFFPTNRLRYARRGLSHRRAQLGTSPATKLNHNVVPRPPVVALCEYAHNRPLVGNQVNGVVPGLNNLNDFDVIDREFSRYLPTEKIGLCEDVSCRVTEEGSKRHLLCSLWNYEGECRHLNMSTGSEEPICLNSWSNTRAMSSPRSVVPSS